MKDIYISVAQCLDDWEFCPLCNERMKFIIKGEMGFYKTTINNTNLLAIDFKCNKILDIDLITNKVLFHNTGIDDNLQLYIDCKDGSIRTGYSLCVNNGVARVDAEYMDVRVYDRKRKFNYQVISYYKDDLTTIYIEDSRQPSWSKVDSELIHLTNLDKKHLLKTIRAHCLLM